MNLAATTPHHTGRELTLNARRFPTRLLVWFFLAAAFFSNCTLLPLAPGRVFAEEGKPEPTGDIVAPTETGELDGQETETENEQESKESPPCLSPDQAAKEQGDLQLYLMHRRDIIPVTPGKEIELQDSRFTLLFNMAEYDRYCHRFVSARVMASRDTDFIENAITVPFEIGETTVMGPGWGMAPDLSLRYDSLILTETGMHYLIYDKDDPIYGQRVAIQRQLTDGLYQFRWDIYSLAVMDEEGVTDLPQNSAQRFSVLFFRDSDLDNVIEAGEFLVFHISVRPDW